jgi:hypothetical protein
MAITISGSTGIVEANIANNAITANKIASDAITTDKIISGAVSAADIASGAIATNLGFTPANASTALTALPAGSVLQVKAVTVTSGASGSTTDDSGVGVNLGLSLSITPKRSGSHFYITCHIGIGSCGGNTWGGILSRDGTRIGNGAVRNGYSGVWFRSVDHTGNNGADTNHGVGGSASHYDTTGSTAGTAITFMCGFVSEGGPVWINYVEGDYSGSAPVVHSGTNSTFTVMEIAT